MENSMPASDPNEKHGSTTVVTVLGIIGLIVCGTMMVREEPITIAANDDPPTLSTPVEESEATKRASNNSAERTPTTEQRIKTEVPQAQPDSQIFYRGWTVPLQPSQMDGAFETKKR
jgi:hypothetical protein